jgi:predicted permease
VVVGGGKPIDALQLLVVQPVLWAALLGLALNALRLPLPGSIAAVAAALAPANKALMLLSAGMLLQPSLPQPRQVRLHDCTRIAQVCICCFNSIKRCCCLLACYRRLCCHSGAR